MKRALLILFFIGLKFSLFAQHSEFGGLFIRPTSEDMKGTAVMNFNPALNFSGGQIPLAYSNVLSKSYTLFYVYKQKKVSDGFELNEREYPFLELHFNGRISNATSSFFSGDKKFFIQANHRLTGTMVNHYGTFTPSKVGSKMQANFLFLFNRPNIELYEVILFPSFLPAEEYAKIYSYLGIKYSIPLPSTFNYVDAEGTIIWDAKENKDYATRIIGLGRQDKMHLKQYQSKTYADSLLTVGFNESLQSFASDAAPKDIPDNSYVILGDNNGSLKFEKKNRQEQLDRKWKIMSYKTNTDLHFFFDRQAIEGIEKPKGEKELSYAYYASVSAKESAALAKLIPLEVKQDSLLYCSLPLSTGQTFLSIIRKQKIDFDFTYQINCDALLFKMNVQHGVSPFTLAIETEEGIQTVKSSTNTWEVSLPVGLMGKVSFVLEDALGNRKRRELETVDVLLPPIFVASNYFLSPKGMVEIQPTSNEGLPENLTYAWYDAKHTLISTASSLVLKEIGSYALEVGDQNNTYCFHFTVSKAVDEKITYKMGLYPNPVEKLEEFVVYIPLETTQDAEVLVYTNKGQLVDYKMYRNTPQVLYKSRITTTGMYIVVVKTKEQKQFYRLMVK